MPRRRGIIGLCCSPFAAAMHKYASTMGTKFTWDYDRGETVADAVVHILGIAIAIGGAAVLTVIAVHQGDIREVTAVAIYLVGFLAMIGFSAAYNLWPVSPLKWWLRRLDHSAIYLLIAATYTAFMLPMHGMTPALVLAVIWAVALAGIAIKLVWPGRFDRTAVGLYLSMGWSGIFTIGPITAALAPGHAMAHRRRRRALFGGRHLSRLEQAALSECDLARLRADRRAVPLRCRADVAGHVTASVHPTSRSRHSARRARRRRWRGDVQSRLQAWPRGHCLKEDRRSVQVGAIESVAENQESEGTGCHSRR
jgi:hemolysin III